MPVHRIEPPTCEGCAACCHGLLVLVEACDSTPRALTALSEYPRGSGRYYRAMKQVGERETCIALDVKTGRCSIYDQRPAVCREFETHGVNCMKVLARNLRDRRD